MNFAVAETLKDGDEKDEEHGSETLLFFCHADCLVDATLFEVVCRDFQDRELALATLSVHFPRKASHQTGQEERAGEAGDSPSATAAKPSSGGSNGLLFSCVEGWCRQDGVLCTFGDQGLIIRAETFQQLGGFPAWPLFEDVKLFQTARRSGHRIRKLPVPILASRRRFDENGGYCYAAKCLGLLLLYKCGVGPHALAQAY